MWQTALDQVPVGRGPGVGGFRELDLFDVHVFASQYGVKGDDGTGDFATSNRIGLEAAVAACVGKGKILWLPSGVVKIDNAIGISGGISIRGCGMSGQTTDFILRGTVIRPVLSRGAFDVTSSEPVSFHDFTIAYVGFADAGTSAIIIHPSSDQYMDNLRIANVGFQMARIGINIDKTNVFNIIGCNFWACKCGIQLQNTVNNDIGDSTVSHCSMTMEALTAGIFGILMLGSGGLRVENNKFNGGQVSVLVQLSVGASTGILVAVGNSMEGVMSAAIWLQRAAAGTHIFMQVVVVGNQIGMGVPDGNMIRIPPAADGIFVQNLAVVGNTFVCSTSEGVANYIIMIDSVQSFAIVGNIFRSSSAGTATRAVVTQGAAIDGVISGNQYMGSFGPNAYVNPLSVSEGPSPEKSSRATATQLGSKSTDVACDGMCGSITTHNASIPATSTVSFLVLAPKCTINDVVTTCIASGATAGSYTVGVEQVNNGSFRVLLRNISTGALAEAVKINFNIMRVLA